jgi:hypothetical protein
MSVEHANPAFWAALAAFQGAVRGVGKDRKNPHLNNKYATLESVFETIREPLAAHNLSVTQMSLVDDGRAGCRTVVAHAEGGYIECTLMLPLGEQRGISAAQAVGICLSYARRYALMGVLGLATADEDTDGGPPAGKGTPPKPNERPEPAPRRVAAPPPPKADPAPAPESPTAAPAPTTPAEAGSDGGTVTRGKWALAEQRAFFAALGKLGMTYDPVCAICAERNRPRPSNMAPDDRKKLLSWLETDVGRAAYAAAAEALASSVDGPQGGAE